VHVGDAENDVVVGVVTGNAIVETVLDPGTTTQVEVERGDIELRIPEGISVDLQATVRSTGQIVPDHPRLPPFFGRAGDTYNVQIAGGLAVVRLSTVQGNIVIRSR
jgi:hypothetical protein